MQAIQIKYLGLNEDKKWSHFAWSVNINGEVFQYKTGLGHAIDCNYDSYNAHSRMAKLGKLGTKYTKDGKYLIEIPKIDDILHCLFLDASCGQESFSEFCDNYGYSNDSLTALDIYRACEDTSKRLRKALGTEFHNEQKRIAALEL